MKKILLIFAITSLLTGCGSVELSNGEKAIVSFKDGEGISAEELYEELKEIYGVDYLVNLIDTKLLEIEYDETNEEREYVEQVVEAIKSETGSEEEFISYIKYYYGVNTEKAFREYIKLNYRRSMWIEDYAYSMVTDKQVEEYYNEVAVGDMELSHILITSEATEDMTDDEIKAAETNAYNKAKELISRLDKGEEFATLAKEFSDDTGSKEDGGALGTVNYGMNYDEDFVDGAVDLKEGAYSKTPVKTQFGYHIILKTKQSEKKTLEELTDSIKQIIADEAVNNASNTGLYLEAIMALRSEYEMDIVDGELDSGYEKYLSDLRNGQQ